MQDAVRTLRDVAPPPRLSAGHSQVLGALNYFERAAQELRQYLATGDSTLVRATSYDLLQGLAALDDLGLLTTRGSAQAVFSGELRSARRDA